MPYTPTTTDERQAALIERLIPGAQVKIDKSDEYVPERLSFTVPGVTWKQNKDDRDRRKFRGTYGLFDGLVWENYHRDDCFRYWEIKTDADSIWSYIANVEPTAGYHRQQEKAYADLLDPIRAYDATRVDTGLIETILGVVRESSQAVEQYPTLDPSHGGFSMSSYLKGDPRMFRQDVRTDTETLVPTSQRTIDIRVNIASGTNEIRGAAITALVQALQTAGREVELHVIDAASYPYRHHLDIVTRIRRAGEPLDLKDVQFWTGYQSVFSYLFYPIIERSPWQIVHGSTGAPENTNRCGDLYFPCTSKPGMFPYARPEWFYNRESATYAVIKLCEAFGMSVVIPESLRKYDDCTNPEYVQ